VAAAKVTGPKGVEYRIPPAALEALGYKVKVTQSGAVLTAARANLEAETLAVKVRELESSLEVEKIRREAAEQRSADLTQSLSDLREVIAKLPKALEPVKTKRRWFKKS
jgi:chromosome segregation ATPase